MSSFEANAYTAKPANSITVTKPIIQSNLHIKRPQTQQEQHILSQQPKRIQPLIKAAVSFKSPKNQKALATNLDLISDIAKN